MREKKAHQITFVIVLGNFQPTISYGKHWGFGGDRVATMAPPGTRVTEKVDRVKGNGRKMKEGNFVSVTLLRDDCCLRHPSISTLMVSFGGRGRLSTGVRGFGLGFVLFGRKCLGRG